MPFNIKYVFSEYTSEIVHYPLLVTDILKKKRKSYFHAKNKIIARSSFRVRCSFVRVPCSSVRVLCSSVRVRCSSVGCAIALLSSVRDDAAL